MTVARTAAVSLLAAICMAGARADPADYVFTPYTTPGAVYLQVATGAEHPRGGGSEAANTLSLGWSPTSWWFTQLYAGWYREPGEAMGFDAWSWLNHLRLTDDGRPWSLGLYLELERPRDRTEGDVIVWGPTLQWDTDRTQLNLNVLLEKAVRTAAGGPAQLGYQWQAKRLWQRGMEWGFQGLGEVGDWDHWSPASQQSHVAGPALFRKWPMGSHAVLRGDAALLLGLTDASPHATLRMRLQYEF